MKRKFSKILGVGLTLALLTSMLFTAAPVMAATGPQFLDVVPFDVTTGEWSTTVEATTPQSGDYSYHVVLPAEPGNAGLDIIHKNIYGTGGVGTMTLAELSTMTFWEYVKVAGGTNNLGAGITLYMDMNDDGVFLWADDVQIVLESPYNSAQVLENLDVWALRDIDTFAGFQKGGTGLLGLPFTGVDGVTLENSPWAEWKTSAYSTYPVLWVGIVAGWGFYGNYDGYFDDFIINGDTYVLEPRVINTTTPAGFSNIQDAIDAATAGDTILVADGIYEESISVTTANLTLRSVNGRDSTTIVNEGGTTSPEVSQSGFLIRGPAIDFTLGGAVDQGFTFSGGTAPRLIQLNNGPSGVELSYNTFDSSDTNGTISTGINIGAAGATDLTINNNSFIADDDATYQDWPLTSGGPLTNLTVTYNEFTGSGTPALYGAAIDLNQSNEETATLSGGIITNNTISGFDRGILTGSGDALVENLDISQNDISGCGTGILLRGTAVDMATLTVTENNISGNTYGLKNAGAEVVTAENNWWGSASGPAHADNPGGLGDIVSDYVDFMPWLLSEGGEPVVTYTDYISVPDGWSLISPDRAWADWEALGSDLVLTYDTDILVPAFVEPQSSSLSPLTAIYVKTSGGGMIGVNYPVDDLGMYATSLEAGWNLIGVPETGATTGAILSPLRYGANDETALSTLASQGNYNPSALTFYEDAFTWANITGLTLDPFDGYWAYLNVAKEFGVVVIPQIPQ